MIFVSLAYKLKLMFGCAFLYDYPSRLAEFMINYQGGFVRRGLCGEILLYLRTQFNIDPFNIILPVCLLAYLFVVVFLYRKFKERGFCWWLVFSPLLCGFVVAVIRKDYIQYSLLIAVLLMMRNQKHILLRNVAVTVMLIFSLFIHEAFIFWGVPIVALLMLTERKSNVYLSSFLILLVVATFLLLCYFKGNMDVAKAIQQSWQPYITGYDFNAHDAIGAIGWTTSYAANFHLRLNFLNEDFGLDTILLQGIIYMTAYYLFTNFVFFNRNNRIVIESKEKTLLSATIILLTICMLPMFTILSCDYGRLYQYIYVTTISTFVIIPHDRITCIYPKTFINGVERFNCRLCNVFVPTQGILVFLLLTFAVSPWFFSPSAAFGESILGSCVGWIEYFCMKLSIL